MTIHKIIVVLAISMSGAFAVVSVSGADELDFTRSQVDVSVSAETESSSHLGLSVSIPTTVEPINNAGERSSSRLIKERKYQEAIALLLPLSELGDAESQTQLGSLYENGLGVPLDMDRAIRWYQRAAAQNYPRAQVNLGVLYQYGTGVDKDLTSAIYWFQKASAQKNARAQGKLAYLYLTESGLERDEKEAVRLLESSASGGYDEAQFNFAMLLLRGERGVTIDVTRAIHLLQRAVEQDNPRAMNMLALLYYLDDKKRPTFLRDINLPKDSLLAHHLLQRAATLGYGAARDNLTKLCRQSPELCEPNN